eukprot:s434_g6.t3
MAPMRCTKCGLELEGKYMRFDGNVYHPECLTCEEFCSQCHRPMTTGGFFNGKHWCNDCFVCSSCHGKLETAYTSREMPGKIFCKDCLSHRCSTCQKVIHGRSMNFEGQHHCLECFVCVRCGFGFPDGRVYKKDCGKVCSRCIHRPVDVAESLPPPAAESNTDTRRRLVVKAAKDSETVWQWQGGYLERGQHCGKPLFVRDAADGGVEYVIYYHSGFARWFLGKKVPAATRIRSISVQTDDGARTHTVILEEYDELHNDDRMFEARHFVLGKVAAKLAHWRLEGHWTMQCVSLFAGGFFTHLYAYSGPQAPPLTAPFAFGAFTGVLSPTLAPASYWLALLLLVGCIVWLLVSHFKIFVGFGGRVGFTAFCSCYLVQAMVLMPVGAVEYSAANLLADMLLDGAKVDSVRVVYEQRVWQEDLISVFAPVFGAVTANFLRSGGASLENPITGATAGSLIAFLVLSVSGWSYASVAMNGFAVGSFVGMASFEYLPTTLSFALSGFLAGGFILLLEPYCEGWSGKQGLCASLDDASSPELCSWEQDNIQAIVEKTQNLGWIHAVRQIAADAVMIQLHLLL